MTHQLRRLSDDEDAWRAVVALVCTPGADTAASLALRALMADAVVSAGETVGLYAALILANNARLLLAGLPVPSPHDMEALRPCLLAAYAGGRGRWTAAAGVLAQCLVVWPHEYGEEGVAAGLTELCLAVTAGAGRVAVAALQTPTGVRRALTTDARCLDVLLAAGDSAEGLAAVVAVVTELVVGRCRPAGTDEDAEAEGNGDNGSVVGAWLTDPARALDPRLECVPGWLTMRDRRAEVLAAMWLQAPGHATLTAWMHAWVNSEAMDAVVAMAAALRERFEAAIEREGGGGANLEWPLLLPSAGAAGAVAPPPPVADIDAWWAATPATPPAPPADTVVCAATADAEACDPLHSPHSVSSASTLEDVVDAVEGDAAPTSPRGHTDDAEEEVCRWMRHLARARQCWPVVRARVEAMTAGVLA